MILHTIAEHTMIMPYENNYSIVYKKIGSCICQCNNFGAECKIERIISTDLRDYLNPSFSPGRKI